MAVRGVRDLRRVLVVVEPEVGGVEVALAHPVAGVAARKALEVDREPAQLEVVAERVRVVLMVLDRRLRWHREGERCGGEHVDYDEEFLSHVFLLVPPVVFRDRMPHRARRLWDDVGAYPFARCNDQATMGQVMAAHKRARSPGPAARSPTRPA